MVQKSSKGSPNIFLRKTLLTPVWKIPWPLSSSLQSLVGRKQVFQRRRPCGDREEREGGRERYWGGGQGGAQGRGGRAWREKWRGASPGAGQRMLSLQDALWVVMATVIIYVNS